MNKYYEVDVYKRLLESAPLETDAQVELLHLIALLEKDQALSMSAFANHLYPVLTHSLSAPQTIFLQHLGNFKGNLLREAYRIATEWKWGNKIDEEQYTTNIDYYSRAIKLVTEGTGQKKINSAQLALALTLFNTTEITDEESFVLDDAVLENVIKFEYEEGNNFWHQHGVSVETLIQLARDLLSYNGTQLLASEDIRKRFGLILRLSEGGIKIQPVERAAIHQINKLGIAATGVSELWFPNNTLLHPDELTEFEALLVSSAVSEADWQRFFDRHPTFIYLLGNHEDHKREVILRPQILMTEGNDPLLRPDDGAHEMEYPADDDCYPDAAYYYMEAAQDQE